MKTLIIVLIVIWFITAEINIHLSNRLIEEQEHEIEVLHEYIRRIKRWWKMKNFEEIKKEIIKNNEEIKKLKDKKEEIFREYQGKWSAYSNDNYKIAQAKIEAIETVNDILANNASYIIYEIFKNEIKPILEKYQGKRIGEKTKEKIKEEIKQQYRKNNIKVSSYIQLAGEYYSHSDKINIVILTDEGYTDYRFKECEVNFWYGSEGKNGLNFTGNMQMPSLQYYEDAKHTAEKIAVERESTEAKIASLKKQIEEVRSKFNDKLEGDLYSAYYIKA